MTSKILSMMCWLWYLILRGMVFVTLHFILQWVVFVVSLEDNTQSLAYRWGVPVANMVCSPFVWLLQEGGIEYFTDDASLHHAAADVFSRYWPLWLLANSAVWFLVSELMLAVWDRKRCAQDGVSGCEESKNAKAM